MSRAKILVVDDEHHILEGIRNTVPWEKLGVEWAGEAEGGTEAWRQYQRLKPEILLLDINLPELTGIQLAQRIREQDPEAQIIFLTGYDDFPYMKEAISLQAADYLLKPVKYDDLLIALKKAVGRYAETAETSKRIQDLGELEEQFRQLSQSPQELMLLDALQSRTPIRPHRMPFFDDASPASVHYVIGVEVDSYADAANGTSRDKSLILYAYRKLAQEAADEMSAFRCLTMSDFPGRLIIVAAWAGDAIGRPEEDSMRLARQLQEQFLLYFKTTISVGISRPVANLDRLPSCYEEALHMLEYKSITGQGHIFSDSHPEHRPRDHAVPLQMELNLLHEMSAGNLPLVQSFFQQWAVEYRKMNRSQAKLSAKHLGMSMMRLINETGAVRPNVPGADRLLAELSGSRTDESVEHSLRDYATSIAVAIAGAKEARFSGTIVKAKKYISERLEQDVSLTGLADYLHVSPSHLSMLFKQATGETFTDYTARARFEKAKMLLATTDFKINDIAAKVGFADSNYFSIAFKKYQGMTPSDYKKRTGNI